MGKVFFSVPVNSVRRARCSCPGRCYLSCRIPPTAALQAPSGLGCARVPGKAAGGAVGSGPSGTGGFLSGPTFQAPGSWKDSVGAPPAPDVSLQPHYTQPGCCAVPGTRLQKLPLLRASQHPGTVPCVGTAEQSTGKARKLSLKHRRHWRLSAGCAAGIELLGFSRSPEERWPCCYVLQRKGRALQSVPLTRA